MAKVRMLVCLSGAHGVTNNGEIYECDDAEAQRMLDAGFAEPVVEAKVETRPAKRPVATRAD